MAYDYALLNGKISEVCGTQSAFSNAMGLSERSVSLKLNNKVDWRQEEILKAVSVLGINESDIQSYFFTTKVQAD